MLVERCCVQSFDDAVGLLSRYACGAVADVLELQEQLVRVLVGPAVELTAVVGQHRLDFGVARLEGRQHIVVH